VFGITDFRKAFATANRGRAMGNVLVRVRR